MLFTFRPLTKNDLPLFATWLAASHVHKWWNEPADLEWVTKKYSPSIDGTDPTKIYIVQVDQQPIGIIQSYWVDDYPEHAETMNLPGMVGVDLFIGDVENTGKGYGTALLTQFVQEIIMKVYAGATGVVADPRVDNAASVRAFEKAGFVKGEIVPGEDGLEQLMVLRF